MIYQVRFRHIVIVVFFTFLSFSRSSGEHSGDTFFTPENQLFLDFDPAVGVQEFIGFNLVYYPADAGKHYVNCISDCCKNT